MLLFLVSQIILHRSKIQFFGFQTAFISTSTGFSINKKKHDLSISASIAVKISSYYSALYYYIKTIIQLSDRTWL